MHDVVFITPNVRGIFADESYGTLLLATILKNEGISCKVLPFGHIGNAFEFESFLESALEKIGEINPKIVSLYTRCDTFHISLKLAEKIKERWNNIYIVMGGPQSDTTSYDLIKNVPFVDFVCCGEGEKTIYPFFSSLISGNPDLSVPGLVYRQNGNVVTNSRPELLHDLDMLPVVDYQGTYLDDYPEDLTSLFFLIDVGRGCPFGCAYCSTQAFWGRKYRLKSPARIVEEVKTAYKNFGVQKFIFSHDMFTLNREKVIETCRLIRKLDFPISWACSARLDCIDHELIDIMVEAGMCDIFVGIETGSRRMQKLVHKNLNLDKVMETLLYIKTKNIHVDASFVYGFPEETREDLSQTLALMADIMKNRCGKINTHLCAFLPKTELSERYQDELIFADKYSNFTGNCAIADCEDLIIKYPMLFPQLMEYRTEVRTSLKHFTLFIRVWAQLTPIYQYIAEQYDPNHLIDMYYEFVRVNKDALEKYSDWTPKNATEPMVREDRMHVRLEGEPCYDIVKDIRRIRIDQYDHNSASNSPVSAVYCIDPRNLNEAVSIQDYERCVAVVDRRNGKSELRIYPLKS